jgi:NOL1/NOP2/fmu family ribosome biogenesis protein
MIIEKVVEQYSPNTVLDLCAAPGGKSTLMGSTLRDDALLLSNELVPKRYKILEENVIKWGMLNHLLSCASPQKLETLGPVFDLILVDAPCSGEGLFRKQPEAVKEWNSSNLRRCSIRQKDIMRSASKLITAGGIIIYSTCTLNPDENENVGEWAVKELGLISEAIPFNPDSDLYNVQTKNTTSYYCLPNRMKGEPFFFTILRKAGKSNIGLSGFKRKSFKLVKTPEVLACPEGINRDHLVGDKLIRCSPNALDLISYASSHHLRLKLPEMGTFKRDQFIPSHFSCMSSNHHQKPSIHITNDQVLKLLRLNWNVKLNQTPGWYTACYGGIPFGWIKVIDGGRVNNYYPKSYRIRNL